MSADAGPDVKFDRYARLRAIEALDPENDCREITLLFYKDFQSVMLTKGFNGFMFTYAAPRISSVLSQTGEVRDRLLKRIVDTSLLASAVMEHGFKSEPGRDAARRVNAMHSRYSIHPDDFVAVGAEEALGSLELAERYGWRSVTDKEREALRLFYSRQARAFGSPNPLPDSVPALKALFSGYLDRELRYEPRNAELANILLDFYVSLIPRPLRGLFRWILVADVDPRILRACGFTPPSKVRRYVARFFLRLNGRRDPLPDGAPSDLETMARRVYPEGWTIAQLGSHGKDQKEAPATTEAPI
ncbi:MAG TPA: oxygenase MpaB family protein [Sphingobium sp.]|uniref:oxygenase MpaB family protein n=1 Tax=Sphingobium sp. TaxID=1912891 RepID=UPI002ED47E38